MKYLLVAIFLSLPVLAHDMPKHAHKVDRIWEWECDYGYVQNRRECEKVRVPKNAQLTPDGHNWECKKGYEKYRDECNKEKK